VTKSVLGITKMLGSTDHISIELGSEVVVSILGDVVPFGLRCIGAHDEFVSEGSFRNLKRVVIINDVVVDTEVWNWIVDVISSWLLLVLVLGATSGGADWVRVDIRFNLEVVDHPLVAEGVLSISEMLGGGDHISIELRSEVVVSVFSDIVPFSLGGISSHLELVSKSTLRDGEGVVAVEDLVINTEVRDWVVDVITSWLLFMFVLTATS